uniref:Delphilin-like isoform X3 n=1 Tax=Geotrypetes seraphini TaxID=260995 RepID=A0A6P8T1B1_GEOSA|nr:delphilin-like isoform X3 [Geotrypetes seraphini]
MLEFVHEKTDAAFQDMNSLGFPQSVPQLSQERILEIMNRVKNKEITADEALNLAEREKNTEGTYSNCQDSFNDKQYNFNVYKYRYRWQKRILQIDFLTKTIYNIEKGQLKKQFPFSQIKSSADKEGLRFMISFYGHQNYELEAASPGDKENILALLNKIIQNKMTSSCARRPSPTYVIHEGLLDIYKDHKSGKLKYLVKLKEGELLLYNISCGEADENSGPLAAAILLSAGNAKVNKENEGDCFSVQTKESHYLFQMPVNAQTKLGVDSMKICDKWVELIRKQCSPCKNPLQLQSVSADDTYEYWSTSDEEINRMSNKKPQREEQISVGDVKTGALRSAPASPPLPALPSSDLPFSASKQLLGPTNLEPTSLPPLSLDLQLPVPPPPIPTYTSQPLKKTKAFHWDPVPQEKINKSIWACYNPDKRKINISKIYHQFRIQEVQSTLSNESLGNQAILLDSKIAHNFNIVLKSFQIQPAQLKEKLLILYEDKGGLTDEQVMALRRYVPTPKDVQIYQSFRGSVSGLHIVDQFMFEMCNIPHINRRLDILLIIRELPRCMRDLQPLIKKKIDMCKQLLSSQRFVAVLEYILVIGNYLNENAGKEKAKGFHLSSLAKMPELRGKEKSFTLLHALVEQILLYEPDLATFPQELTEFEAVPGTSVKGLSAEVDVLGKELENIVEYKKLIKPKHHKTTTQETQFYRDLKATVQQNEADHSQLSKDNGHMKKLYSEILQKYGEAEGQDSQELFGWIAAFIRDFKKIHAEMQAGVPPS